ncbi:MAG: 50S ribosomal protein L22 [Alphaproteobacteria bacterium]|nr:50S ribosomal protein L22 [Alphaproteobacteria bacterium]
MSKPKAERRLPDDSAQAKAASLRTGARKLNLVAASIRGKGAAAALTQLAFEKRRIAQDVRKVLQSAVANAENNHNLDVDKLYVAEAWVGRSFVMKRFHARGRGKSAGIEKPFSNLTIIVRERADGEAKPKKTKAKPVKTETVKSEQSAKASAKPAAKAKTATKKTTTKGAAEAAAEA